MFHRRHVPDEVRSLVTAPTAALVTLTEAKAQLRITGTSEDTLVQGLIDAAVAQLDPGLGGWLGRALGAQTWEYRLNGFPWPDKPIFLPYPPLVSITSVKYDDTSGTEQTLALTTGYRLFGQGGLTKVCLMPPVSGCWPQSRFEPESVRIRYACGYSTTIPTPVKQALLLTIRQLYDIGVRSAFLTGDVVFGVGSKQFQVSPTASQAVQSAAETLLSTYRVYE
jgi:uncharacterized phiE125 gp8 family phage protein